MTTAHVAAATPDTRPVEPLLITACGVLAPSGVGLPALAAAMAGHGQPCADPFAVAGADLPPRPARVAALPAPELLGRKGLRTLDRTSLLSLASCALTIQGLDLDENQRARTGTVIGTNGSLRSASEYSRETITQSKPFLVNPSLFPSTVMNCAAGQVAIRNGFKAVNATLAGGAVAGIQAFRYARNAIAEGRADRLIVGAAEEFCAQAAWGWHVSGALEPDAPVGEGAATFLLERLDAAVAPAMAEVLAAEVGYADGAREVRPTLVRVIERALVRSGVTRADVQIAALGSTGQRGLQRIEQRVATMYTDRVLPLKAVTGECFSAGAALQVAAVLATWRDATSPAGVAIVTAVCAQGNVGCLVMRPAGS